MKQDSNTLHPEASFKVATIKNAKDGEPKVTSYTVAELAALVSKPRVMLREYEAYHHHKAEEKRLAAEARVAQASGDIELAKKLKAEAKFYKQQQTDAKDGTALMPYQYKNDLTFKTSSDGYKQRDNTRITHFSMLMLDIESQITTDEIHAVLAPFEYLMWPTISHKPTDPRYRVVLFLETPLSPTDAVAVNARIDSYLPERNDLTKKTQAIDPACLDEQGRLMYLPAWLNKHPEKYSCVHNSGRFVTVDDFKLSTEQQDRVNARSKLGDASRKERIKTHQAKIVSQASDDSTVLEKHGKFYLNPNGYLETDEGWVRVGDVRHKIGGVACPVHGDSNGTEFAAWNAKSDNVFLRCKHCGTVWADKEREDAGKLVLPWAKRTAPIVLKKADKPVTGMVLSEQTTITRVTERYLDPETRKLIADTGITLIKSPKGTGKTTILAPFIDDCRREGKTVTLIGHRVNLLRELSEKLDLDYYLDLGHVNKQFQFVSDGLSEHLAICMDSLTRYDPKTSLAPHTIIIDESEQVFKHLASGTLKGRRTQVFNSLIWLLRSATRIIVLDADMTSDMSLEMLLMLRGRTRVQAEPYLGVINDYVFNGRGTLIYESWHHLLAEAVQAVQDGRKVFLSTNFKANGADVFARIFEALGKKVLLVTSHTSVTNPDVTAFMTNTSEESKKYDVIVCTPTVQTGVSIDNDHFDDVYGIFWNAVGTFQDIDQAMSRVRRVNLHKVWIQEVDHKAEPKSEQEIYEEVQQIERQGARKLIHGEEPSAVFTKGEMLWAEIYARIEYLTQEWSRHKLLQFIDLRESTGYELDAVMCDAKLMKYGKELYDTAADIPSDTLVFDIWNAVDISEYDQEDIERLLAKRNRSHDEYLQVERYKTKRALGALWSLETLARAVEQDLLRVTSKLDKLVNWSFEQQLAYDTVSREHNSITFSDSSHLTLKSGLIDVLCDAMKYPLNKMVADAKAVTRGELEPVEITTVQLLAMATVFEENKREFSRYLKCRIKEPTAEANLVKVWKQVLGEFLPLKTERKQVNGERTRRYFVSVQSNDLLWQLFPD